MPDSAVLLPRRDVAVIDIGSNSVRLVLYRCEGRAVWTLFNEKVLAGLGRDLSTTGALSPDGRDLALSALRRFRAVLDAVGPDHIEVVATAAMRDGSDAPDFAARITDETGFQVRVLSGEQEGHYAALGALAGSPRVSGLVADMGGSSLELIEARGAPGRAITLPLGAFALMGPKGFDAARTRKLVRQRLKGSTLAAPDATLLAVGGSWRSLALLHMQMCDYPLRIVHQYAISAREARSVIELLERQSGPSLERIPGLSKKRIETLPYAAMVLEGLIEQFDLKRVTFSAWGLREGVLFEALGEASREVDPLIAGSLALGTRAGLTPGLPDALRRWLMPLMNALPPALGDSELAIARERTLVHAACALADVGAGFHPDHRADLAFEQVLRAPVPGQTHQERAFLALTIHARYSSSPPPASELVERLLDEEVRQRARALGQALRLGCDLSGRATTLLEQSRLSAEDGLLILSVSHAWRALLMGEQTAKRAQALATTLGLDLVLNGN